MNLPAEYREDAPLDEWDTFAVKQLSQEKTVRCTRCEEPTQVAVVHRHSFGFTKRDFYARVAFVLCQSCEDEHQPGVLIERLHHMMTEHKTAVVEGDAL